jgi:23S rRNA (guanosine2251-2'-O)-methyltransferase
MKHDNRKAGSRSELRVKFSEDLIWGMHPVLEALRSEPERITELILQKDKRGTGWQEIIDCARDAHIKCSFAERITITGSLEENIIHQGVIARGAPVKLLPFEELLEQFGAQVQNQEHPKVIACDCIQDPHNLGAIIRSAHAAGVEYVLLTRERSAPIGGTAAKAAAGALSRVKICQVTNLADGLLALKEVGAWVFGAVKDPEGKSIYQSDLCLPACLVVGNEAKGIRPLVQKTCDVLISIPMAGDIDSLNSSVAGAVILFEMHRQKLSSEGK